MSLSRDARINYLNIGLMILSAISAYFFPFETFLMAYAFLGPLHYLTEISWLHDRQYFSKGKYDFIVLLTVGVLLSIAAFAKDFNVFTQVYDYFAEANLFDKLLVLALFSAVLFVFVRSVWIKVFAILFLYIFISGWLSPDANQGKPSTTVFALTSLVPTLIHVYVFTGLFMLFGALKARSKTGLWSVVFFILTPLFLVYYLPTNPEGEGNLTSYGKEAYYAEGTGFFNTNVSIMRQFDLAPVATNRDYLEFLQRRKNRDLSYEQRFLDQNKNRLEEEFKVDMGDGKESTYPAADLRPGASKDNWWDLVFFSPVGIMLMRFIAFAYLYHYLNWFSKTEIIRWHKVPKVRFVAVVFLWLTACGLYAYNYALGLSFLFFLSFTHVLLEFPLNITSMVGIGKESLAIIKNGFGPKEIPKNE